MSDIVKAAPYSELSLLDPNYLAAMDSLSKKFAHSEMVPDFYKAGAVLKKGQPPQSAEKAEANCFIALNMAMRLKADPLMVMQNMKPIMGSPSLSAKFIIALINNSGVYEDLEFDFVDKGPMKDVPYVDYEWDPKSGGKVAKNMVFKGPVNNLTCTAKTTKKGSTRILKGPEVSIKMAIEELWYTKSGSKWPNMTELMLMYRAATMWSSAHAPNITMGLPSTEEQEDRRNVEAGEYVEVSSKIKGAAEARKTVKMDVQADEKKPEPAAKEPEPEEAKEEEPLPSYMSDDLDPGADRSAEGYDEEDEDDIPRIEH